MIKERQASALELEKRKKAIEEEAQSGLGALNERFGAVDQAMDDEMTSRTVGLVSKEDYKKLRTEISTQAEPDKPKKKKKKKADLKKLSFGEDEEDEEPPRKFGKISKDSSVKTDFLPDKEKEEALQRKKDELKQSWLAEQEKLKQEPLDVTFSYFDGSGHRRKITVTKGTTILGFLEAVRRDLKEEFKELRGIAPDNLLYVKEDLILPHHMTFWDFIITKARGKSGPLFAFDVHEEQRTYKEVNGKMVLQEATESHPGKIVERNWYEKNKGTFPTSRWEIYDANKKWESYSTGASGIVRDEKGQEKTKDGKFLNKIS